MKGEVKSASKNCRKHHRHKSFRTQPCITVWGQCRAAVNKKERCMLRGEGSRP